MLCRGRQVVLFGAQTGFKTLVVLTLHSCSTEVYPDDIAFDGAAESWSQGVKHQHIYPAAELRFQIVNDGKVLPQSLVLRRQVDDDIKVAGVVRFIARD